MKKKLFPAAMLGIVLIFASILFAQEQAPAPVFQEGDTWVFRVTEKDYTTKGTKDMDGDYEVIYSLGKVRVQRPGGEKIEVKQGGALIRILGIENDERQFLQFPVVVGKKWSTSYQDTARGSGGHEVNRRSETTVTGEAKIDLPAGSYQVFKIERHEQQAAAGKAGGKGGKLKRNSYTYYYSSQARSIVKYKFEREDGHTQEIELIKFTPGR